MQCAIDMLNIWMYLIYSFKYNKLNYCSWTTSCVNKRLIFHVGQCKFMQVTSFLRVIRYDSLFSQLLTCLHNATLHTHTCSIYQILRIYVNTTNIPEQITSVALGYRADQITERTTRRTIR